MNLKLKNLAMISQYIENHVKPHEFDMSEIRNALFISPDNCGTVGCALGYAPFVEGLEPIDVDYHLSANRRCLDWDAYMFRILGIDRTQDVIEPMDQVIYLYLFSGGWVAEDNTPKGFMRRAHLLTDMQNFDIACRIIYTMYWRAMEPPDLPMHEKNKTLFADWNDLVKGAEKDMERGLIITHEGCP